jgi:hypothetical protein
VGALQEIQEACKGVLLPVGLEVSVRGGCIEVIPKETGGQKVYLSLRRD